MCRVADVIALSLLVGFDTGWGGVFNIARTISSMIKLVSLRSILKIRSARSVAAVVPGKSLFPLDGPYQGRLREKPRNRPHF